MKTTKVKSKDIVQEVQEEFEVRKIINEFEDEAIPDIHMALKKFMHKLDDIRVDYYHYHSDDIDARVKNKKPIDKFVAEFIKLLDKFLGQISNRSSWNEKIDAFERMKNSIESSYSKIFTALEAINKPYIGKLSHTRYEDFAKGHELLKDFLHELCSFTCMRLETKDKILDVFQTIITYIYAKNR